MANNEFVGSALYAQWVAYNYSSGTISGTVGTVTLNTESRSFSYTPSISTIDATAGADAAKRILTYMKDGQISTTQVMQSDMGTVTMNSLAEGVSGTMTWGEAGTAVGAPKHVAKFISMGASYSAPYSDVVTFSVTFQQDGARTDSAY